MRYYNLTRLSPFDTNVSVRTIVGQRFFRDWTKLLKVTEWYPDHPPSFTNFSSDMDESQNRSLGQVGGTRPPPRGYATGSPNALSHSSRSDSYSCCCLPVTSSYLLLAPEDLKQGTRRSSATQIPTVNRSFLTQSACGTLYRRYVPTVTWQSSSRLVWALHPIHLVVSDRVFIILHKQCFYLFPVHPVITALLNFHGTQLFSACGAILLSIELAPFLEDKKDEIHVNRIQLGRPN